MRIMLSTALSHSLRDNLSVEEESCSSGQSMQRLTLNTAMQGETERETARETDRDVEWDMQPWRDLLIRLYNVPEHKFSQNIA